MRRVVSIILVLLFSSGAMARTYTLREAVLVALKENPQVRSYVSQRRSAQAQVRVVLSQFFPSVYLGLTYQRYRTEPLRPVTDYTFGPSFTWNIFSGFSTLNRLLEEERLSQAADLQVRKVSLAVAMKVVDAYVDYLKARALLEAAEADLRDARANLRLVKKRWEVGLSPKADLYNAQAKVEDARFNVVSRGSQVMKARGALAVAMGLSVVKEVVPREMKKAPPEISIEEALKTAMEKRPEILAASKEVEAQKREVAAVKGEFLPSVDISGKYVRHDESLFPDDREEWNIMVQVSFPIFTGLSTHWKLRRERALLHRKEWDRRDTELAIQKEVWFAYQDSLKARGEFRAAKRLFESAQEDMRVMRGKYTHGLASVVDLTTSQSRLADARAKFVSSKFEVYRTYYALVKGMGYIPGLER